MIPPLLPLPLGPFDRGRAHGRADDKYTYTSPRVYDLPMVTTKPISTLELPGYESYTRDSYFKRFGKPAPPADPTKRPKAWIGSGAFWFLENQTLVRNVVPSAENDVNIEGAGPFPKYELAATSAHPLNAAPGSTYNALYLSLEAEARDLMAQLQGFDFADDGALPPQLVYPADEPRREWEFNLPSGIRVNAGSLLYVRNQQGVHSPGHWDLGTAVPSWVPDRLVPTGPAWSKPCRPLASNEKIIPAGLFGFPTLAVDDGIAAPAAGGSGYTQADRDRDTQILALLKRIATERLGLVI